MHKEGLINNLNAFKDAETFIGGLQRLGEVNNQLDNRPMNLKVEVMERKRPISPGQAGLSTLQYKSLRVTQLIRLGMIPEIRSFDTYRCTVLDRSEYWNRTLRK